MMKDLFSAQSADYAKYRPQYPDALFSFLLENVPGRNLARDCGTGSGQTARVLAESFQKVWATDISQKQLENAVPHPNIVYALEPAHNSSLADKSVSLITVSQALHWFDFDKFYAEVKRVAAPGALIAAWMYGLFESDSTTEEVILKYYHQTLHGYWDSGRDHIDENYSRIPFPFERIPSPKFEIKVNWTLDELIGYLTTWSAYQTYRTKNGPDPLLEVVRQLEKHWPAGEVREIRFPLTVLVGRVNTVS